MSISNLSYFEKSYGTILRDHPDVDELARQCYTASYKDIDISRTLPRQFLYGDILKKNVSKKFLLSKILPKKFAGQVEWTDYITLNEFMGLCGDSWATALVQAISDRYVIFTLGQIETLLSSTEIVMCGDLKKPRMLPQVKSQVNMPMNNICTGYSVYDAAKYIYQNGISEAYCFSKLELLENGYKQPSDFKDTAQLREKYPTCAAFFGENREHCLNPRRAKRVFKMEYLLNIAPDEKFATIKYEIYKWGPVVGSFLLYKDFLENYDGLSIYEGPPDPSKDYLGGLSIKIMGWGYDEEKKIDYWECSNFWSSIWGNNSTFRMKMGIKPCMLEENIVAPVINIPGNYIPLSIKPIIPVDWLLKTPPVIDEMTFYTKETIKAIKEGKLKGSLNPIYNKNYLPDYDTFWASDVDQYLNTMAIKLENKRPQHIVYGILACILGLIFGYLLSVRKRLK